MAKKRNKVEAAIDGARPAQAFVSRHPGTGSLHGLPPGCPIVPLGLLGQIRFYLDTDGQMVSLGAKEHTKLQITGLFSRRPDFIFGIDSWVRRNEEGTVTGWRADRIAMDLMQACSDAGVWDPNQRERGRGAWLGEDGELIVHAGDQVFVHGTLDPWGLRIVKQPGLIGRHVYPAGEPTAKPMPELEADAAPAQDVLDLLGTWTWRRPDLDPLLLLGWISAAMIGGALAWRPVCWLTGGKGTGKSTLQKVIGHLLGDDILQLADTSAAAIWQTLAHQTLPVAVDELEATEDNRKAWEIVKLARIAASGGKMARGTEKHTAVEFILQNCFLFSSVLVPPMGGPDLSRIALLELDPLPPESDEPDLDPARLRAIGSALRRQLIAGWGRWSGALAAHRRGLNAGGTSKRGADQFGTLLAAADLAMFGTNGAATTTAVWCSMVDESGILDQSEEQRDEDQCLQHLLASQIDATRNGVRTNIGEWINRAAGRADGWDDPRAAARILQTYGIRFETIRPASTEGRQTYWLAIANTHTALATIFERTRWQTPRGTTGVWMQALRRLPGAEKSEGVLYFGGSVSRAILLPLALIPASDAMEFRPIFDNQSA